MSGMDVCGICENPSRLDIVRERFCLDCSVWICSKHDPPDYEPVSSTSCTELSSSRSLSANNRTKKPIRYPNRAELLDAPIVRGKGWVSHFARQGGLESDSEPDTSSDWLWTGSLSFVKELENSTDLPGRVIAQRLPIVVAKGLVDDTEEDLTEEGYGYDPDSEYTANKALVTYKHFLRNIGRVKKIECPRCRGRMI